MGKSGVLAQICIALMIAILLIILLIPVPLVFSDKQQEDITDIVNISRNIYNVSVQDAEKYLREKNIEYNKQAGQFKVKNVFFIIKDNILIIDPEENGISRNVNIIINTDLSDADRSFSDDETTYYLNDVCIIEKDGDFRYYEDSILKRAYGIFLYIVISALAGFILYIFIVG